MVAEVDDHRVGLLYLSVSVAAVQPTQRLDALDAAHQLVDEHGMQQRLVEARLELLSHNQYLELRLVELLADGVVLDAKAVHALLAVGLAVKLHLPREGHKALDGIVILQMDNLVDKLFVHHRRFPRIRHHHGLGSATNLVDGVLHEIRHHHLGLLPHIVRVGIQCLHDELDGLLLLVLVFINGHLGTKVIPLPLHILKHGLVGHIVLQHIEDEFLVDGLLHGVVVVRLVILAADATQHFIVALLGSLVAKQDIGLVLRRGREGVEAQVAHLLPHALHVGQRQVVGVFIALFKQGAVVHRQCLGQVFHGLVAHGCVCLVHDDGILPICLVLQERQREAEFLHRTHDDARGIGFIQCRRQLIGSFSDVAHCLGHFLKGIHVVSHVRVQHDAVGHHDDAVIHGIALGIHRVGQLVRKPSHRLGLARTCRVLNQVVMASAFRLGKANQFPHSPQLVESREENRVFFVRHLHPIGLDEMLDDVQQALGLPDVTPQVSRRIVAFNSRIDAVLVERQEVGVVTLQPCRHEGIVVIHRKMHQAAPQEAVVWVAVFAVLHDAVGIVLVGELILQLRCDDGQAVDEDNQVDAVLAVLFVERVPYLPHRRKAVSLIEQVGLAPFGCHFILEGHKPHLRALDLDALLQHMQHTLVVEGAVIHTHHLIQGTFAKLLCQLGPCLRLGFHEAQQLATVAHVLDVEVLVLALAIHRATSQTIRDMLFKLFLSQSVHNCMFLYLFCKTKSNKFTLTEPVESTKVRIT